MSPPSDPDRPLRIAFFVGAFPVPSETFILRQITGLLDLGHHVDIYADVRGDVSAPVQPEIERYGLLSRTTFMDMPPECAPWELPAWPVEGETWLPGADSPLQNRERHALAAPVIERCRRRAPELTAEALDESAYGYRARSFSALHRLDRLVAEDRAYDVLHAHFGPVGESFRFARALWKAPFVVSFHGYDFSTVPRKEGNDCYRRLFATADRVTVNSRYTLGRVTALGCPESKLVTLPMGLEPEAFEFRERRRTSTSEIRILTVARLVEIKGHEFCLRAVAEARRRHPGIRYDIVGDGPLRQRLERQAAELGIRDAVTFHGTLAGPALRPLLASAHLGLLGSVSVSGDQEGQGLALLEAQACGLPVIATRHGAFPEVVRDGITGWLVAERDVAATADAIDRAILSEEEWPAMGRAGRQFVETSYAIRPLNERLVRLYRDCTR